MKISTSTTVENPGEGLKREIGVWGVFINVINNTVGSGIFLLPPLLPAYWVMPA